MLVYQWKERKYLIRDQDGKYRFTAAGKEDPRAVYCLIELAELEHIESYLKIYQEENSNLECRNNRLYSILKEKANAERKIYPKKERSGFLLLASVQVPEHYVISWDFDSWRKKHPELDSSEFVEREKQIAYIWKSTLQSPYFAELPFADIKNKLYEDFIDVCYEKTGIVFEEYDLSQGFKKLSYEMLLSSENRSYRWIFRSNFKTGFWEIDFWHTRPLEPPTEFLQKSKF